jgi:hypothetical protein
MTIVRFCCPPDCLDHYVTAVSSLKSDGYIVRAFRIWSKRFGKDLFRQRKRTTHSAGKAHANNWVVGLGIRFEVAWDDVLVHESIYSWKNSKYKRHMLKYLKNYDLFHEQKTYTPEYVVS